MTNAELLENIKNILRNSVGSTYAGNGKKIEPQRPGYKELEYREGDWYLRDSYTGHYQAPGMTTIYYKDKPVWAVAYSGKLQEHFYSRSDEAYNFLKQALKRKDLKQANDLPVRGPSEYEDGDWKYTFTWEGDLSCFYGREKIFYKGEEVYCQDIIGGLVIHRLDGKGD